MKQIHTITYFTRIAQKRIVQYFIEGHANAAHNLGLAHLSGEGIEQNSEVAMKYLRLASDQGCYHLYF